MLKLTETLFFKLLHRLLHKRLLWEVYGGSWEVSEGSWEVSVRSKGGHGGHREVVE